LTEGLAALSWKQTGEVVETDHRERRVVGDSDRDGGRRKSAVFRIDWDGIVRICGVAAYVTEETEFAVGGGEGASIEERRNGGRQVNAVDDIGFGDLGEWTAFCGLFHVPLEYVLFWDTGLTAEVGRTATAAAKSTNDEDTGFAAGLGFSFGQSGANVAKEMILIRVWIHTGERFGGG
jgi:hypothetical protein